MLQSTPFQSETAKGNDTNKDMQLFLLINYFIYTCVFELYTLNDWHYVTSRILTIGEFANQTCYITFIMIIDIPARKSTVI